MIKCDDINKKTNQKCSSDAKWKVKINNETEYIYDRCGRHSINMDRKIIINDLDRNIEKDKKGKNPKNDNNIKNTIEKKEDKYVNGNLNKLFLKIDELCNLLNKTDINNK